MTENTNSPYVADDLARDNAIPGSVNPLDLPLVGAGPVVAVTRFYKNYVKFTGRASRSEYWWVAAFFAVVYTILGAAALAAGSATAYTSSQGSVVPGRAMVPFLVILAIFGAVSVVPSIALGIRRLHDANFSGLLYLVVLVPYLGSLALLVLSLLPSKPEGARFDVFGPVYPGIPPFDAGAVPNGRPESAYPMQNRQTPPGF